MGPITISMALSMVEWLLCLLPLLFIVRRGSVADYKYLCYLLLARLLSSTLLLPLLLFGGHGIEAHRAYQAYFYIYWSSFAVEAVLGLLLIKSLFDLAMLPLPGIKRLGVLVFRWIAGISVTFTLAAGAIPRISQMSFITGFITEMQRTQGLLTLCLLLFVCFAVRPLGLTYSSRVFGVNLGLGILATTNLLASSWLAHFKHVHSVINTAGSLATCAALLLWTAYFTLPEPKRRIVVLPTTSPFHRWNQIALALGDPPGHVAIAGVAPDLFAPAEIEMMRLVSNKTAQRSISLADRSLTA